MIDVVCEVCNRPFSVKPARLKRGNRVTKVRFCSLACRAESDKRNVRSVCPSCGTSFHVSKGTKWKGEPQVYCSRSCSNRAKPQKLSMLSYVTTHGYMEIRMPGHPRARNGRVYVHIVAAENKLGRPLGPDEQVHHINGNRRDNRASNLQVLSASEHGKLHYAARTADTTPRTERWRKNFARLPDTTPAS